MRINIALIESGDISIESIVHSINGSSVYINYSVYGIAHTAIETSEFLSLLLNRFQYEITKNESDISYKLLIQPIMRTRVRDLLCCNFPNRNWCVWMNENEFKISYKERNFIINCTDDSCNFFELGDEVILKEQKFITFQDLEFIIDQLSR